MSGELSPRLVRGGAELMNFGAGGERRVDGDVLATSSCRGVEAVLIVWGFGIQRIDGCPCGLAGIWLSEDTNRLPALGPITPQ